MVMKQIYKTARGREIDMIKLVKQNEMTVAVGNANVNARGDKLGPGGQIIKRREEIVSEAAGTIPAPAVPPTSAPVAAPVATPKPAPAPVAAPAPAVAKKDVQNMDPLGEE
jgi:hypothetical protein